MVATARFVALADCHWTVCGMWMGLLEVCFGLRWVMELDCDWNVLFALYWSCCILPDAGLDALCFVADLGSNGQIVSEVIQV